MPELKTLCFDIETDGLLDTVSKVHCLVIKEVETGASWVFRGDDVLFGVDLLGSADKIVGHNIIAYDLEVLKKLYHFEAKTVEVEDTLVYVRLMYPNIGDSDKALFAKGKLSKKLIGSQSLEAWGYRLDKMKGDYAELREKAAKDAGLKNEEDIRIFVWGSWNQDMEDYCVQDVEVTTELYKKVTTEYEVSGWPSLPLVTEHSMAWLMAEQEKGGIYFDVEAAKKLKTELENIFSSIETEAKEVFPARFEPTEFVHLGDVRQSFNKVDWDKVGNEQLEDAVFSLLEDGENSKVIPNISIPAKTLNFKKADKASKVIGCPFTPVKFKEFNPTSRTQISEKLLEMGWKPDELTETGNPSITDETLTRAAEEFSIAKPIADLFTVQKRLSQLSEGNQAWLLKVTADGRIHHNVNPCGAVTGRATHRAPNLGQVPRVTKKSRIGADGKKEDYIVLGRDGGWGFECRSLFGVKEGFKIVGSDLSGIELRCLAHYTYEYDEGEYARILLEGDPHNFTWKTAELETRDQAKTFIFAYLYGAGDEKIGSIVAPDATPSQQAQIGNKIKKKFIKNFPGLGRLQARIKKDLETQGYLVGLDGRRLHCRAAHSALNTLLQSAGAIVSKYWLLQIDDDLYEANYQNNWRDYSDLLWIHDETQKAVRFGIEEDVAKIMVDAAEKAGKFLKFNMPIKAESKIGNNWAESH
jgi:DNA polymerase I-like protein with 3'-5' exonuclease and polymerase domains